MSQPKLFQRRGSQIEAALGEYLDRRWPSSPESKIDRPPDPTLGDAVRYSLLAGGKRLRPLLALGAAELFSDDPKAATPLALAVEMIHAYSLIHDDLPCMDDDDLRRGRPSCHRAFGEALALLAGDALLTEAFAALADAGREEVFSSSVGRWVRLLARAAGAGGMVGGQALDLALEGRKEAGLAELRAMHAGKTGALIAVSCRLGAECGFLSAGGSSDKLETAPELEAVRRYGESIGLGFQIADDLLDATAPTEKLGKTAGKDARQNKTTYVSLLGVEESARLAKKTVEEAKEALRPFGDKAGDLLELADFIIEREH